jgi:SAM-dependent methyltransferase/uncharacterized protein YbaR (Trm112 family)
MVSSDEFDTRLLDLLECPRDHTSLSFDSHHLCCAKGHQYPIVNGVPVFLLSEKEQTIGIATESLRAAVSAKGGPLYVDTLGVSEREKRGVEQDWVAGSKIDSVISYLIGATSGWGYLKLVGRLESYPIPDIPVERGNGELLLDIGSNWGRWSVSAARKGWRVLGIEPSLGAIMAARRAFSGMNLDASWICGDARFLPFKAGAFQCAFSYSVIQHFSESDAELAIAEIGRVLRHGGFAKIQMAHDGGLRSTYSRTRPDYLAGGAFRVRYWSLAALRSIFETHIGRTRLMAEAFGGLGLLAEDKNYVSVRAKVLITVSSLLKRFARVLPTLIHVADSVYVVSIKQ